MADTPPPPILQEACSIYAIKFLHVEEIFLLSIIKPRQDKHLFLLTEGSLISFFAIFLYLASRSKRKSNLQFCIFQSHTSQKCPSKYVNNSFKPVSDFRNFSENFIPDLRRIIWQTNGNNQTLFLCCYIHSSVQISTLYRSSGLLQENLGTCILADILCLFMIPTD